jgi:2-oxoglutarate dehydrogenase E1 component
MSDFTTGGFKEVIDDANIKSTTKVKRVLLCSGKMYFDLSEKQLADKREDVAIVRLEQIYPLPQQQLNALREKYKKAEWIWVQEEPRNMGALSFLQMNGLSPALSKGEGGFEIKYMSRPASASTATGFAKKHAIEQQQLVNEAFA